MEKNAANNLNYLVRVTKNAIDSLSILRKWEHLTVGSDTHHLWVKGLNYAEIHSESVRSIPFIDRFEERNGQLYRLDKLLPETQLPDVLWTPITRGIPVSLPSLNHNYFGVSESVEFTLTRSDKEQFVCGHLIDQKHFRDYMETAPEIRLLPLEWTITDDQQVFVLGTPLLPLPGIAFWKRGKHLIPAGMDFTYSAFEGLLYNKLCQDGVSYILWRNEQPQLLPLFAFETLSISSVRSTFNQQKPPLYE